MKTISDIRFLAERETGVLDDYAVINWCNDCNADISTVINVASDTPHQIAVNTTDLEYPLPDDLKEINRLWLQSEYDSGINREIRKDYTVYNRKIRFSLPFSFSDTLNVEYYKILTVFTDVTDEIELDDQYSNIYTNYCIMRYYLLPSTINVIGEQAARRGYEFAERQYHVTKMNVANYYGFNNPQLSVRERW